MTHISEHFVIRIPQSEFSAAFPLAISEGDRIFGFFAIGP
jgi:hypothetical protein